VLVVNAGSSSLKLTLIGARDETLAERELAAPQASIDQSELRSALDAGLGNADVVGHRIVHGGGLFREPVRIDEEVESALRQLVELAPLHQPKSIDALDAVTAALPDLPAVACFDTAFHATLPEAAATYALPSEWRTRWQLRRYGFHGLSHAWVARRVPELLGSAKASRIVSCHLGAGASLCAINEGRSIDTTMGFTPLEGLVMATRSGSVDPGMLLWLLERSDLSERALAHALEHEAGLLGLTGTADMREVLARAAGGDHAAQVALDIYLHRLLGGIGAMTASLQGIDALVFTGGVGEHAAQIREHAALALDFLGIAVDARRNRGLGREGEISAHRARVRTVVVRAREDLEIARQVRALFATS